MSPVLSAQVNRIPSDDERYAILTTFILRNSCSRSESCSPEKLPIPTLVPSSGIATIPSIQNGRIELFVNSTFKRRRWFDKYIRISMFSCDEPNIVIYELDYNDSYYELSTEDIEYLNL